jgi:hypothetical protein
VNPQRDGSALSFLDVLTNGLGSLLVLFFLMSALRSGIISETPTPVDETTQQGFHRGDDRGKMDPFVVLVSGPAKSALFVKGNGDRFLVEGEAAVPPGRRFSVGTNYALLIAEAAPAEGCSIQLIGLRPDATGWVRVFHGEKLLLARTLQPGRDGKMPIWPLVAGGKP